VMGLPKEGGAGEESDGIGAFVADRSKSGREKGLVPSEGWLDVGGGRRSVSVRGGSEIDETTFSGGGGCFGSRCWLFMDESTFLGSVQEASERKRRHGKMVGGEKGRSER